jgi:hypothetical protein
MVRMLVAEVDHGSETTTAAGLSAHRNKLSPPLVETSAWPFDRGLARLRSRSGSARPVLLYRIAFASVDSMFAWRIRRARIPRRLLC